MSILDQFLNKLRRERENSPAETVVESGAGFDLVDPEDPVQWVKLAMGILGGIVSAIGLGVQSIVLGVFDELAGIFDSAADAIPWNFGDSVEGTITDAWTGAIGGPESLQFLITVVALLASFYIIAWGVGYAREEVLP